MKPAIHRIVALSAVPIVCLAVLVIPLGSERSARAEPKGDAEALAELTKRVERLEKAVLTDPFRPKDTVLARLDGIDEQLKAIGKVDDAVDRRLRTIEQDRKQEGADWANALREIERDLDQLRKTTADLANRVKKIENAR